MRDPRFASLIRSAERVFGRCNAGDASEGWPGGDELGLNEDNVVEFSTHDYETFATWFDDSGNAEVLTVITNVHPVKDFTNFIDEVQEKVTTGQALAEPLERCGFFPPLLIQIVNIGERSQPARIRS